MKKFILILNNNLNISSFFSLIYKNTFVNSSFFLVYIFDQIEMISNILIVYYNKIFENKFLFN